MSKETGLPLEGRGGLGNLLTPGENKLLSNSKDACDCPSVSPGPKEATEAPVPSEEYPEALGHVVGGNSTKGDLIRTQPQPLPQPSVDRGCCAGLSNGDRVHPGAKHPSPVPHKVHGKLRSSLSVNSNGSRRSKGSSTGSHEPGSSPEDCCVRCILACLFCQFLSLCDMVVAPAFCGGCTSEACCCCCCADDLGDGCDCPCDGDCGIVDVCCESSDCLEFCMECCGICFPS